MFSLDPLTLFNPFPLKAAPNTKIMNKQRRMLILS